MNTGQTVETTAYSQETLDVLEKMAERLQSFGSDVRHNNHSLNPEWDGRASGFDRAAYYLRQEICDHGGSVGTP
jgi:hypothetical protein